MSKHIEVTVSQGKLRGIVENNMIGGTLIAFREIPYAKPPIGELRFKDPEPAEPWPNVRDASQLGNITLQPDSNIIHLTRNEDCLYLNIYTMDIEPQTKRAVMVWIPGFFFGTSNHDFCGPDYIVRQNVVLVTINYRSGVFGFLNLDNEMAPGNQGLKDALMALRWVHDNISNFSGDPENVTIFGQGFGGAIVHYLAMCPQADGLLHKAISQSGTAAYTRAFSEKEAQRAKIFQLVKKLGGQTTDPKDAVTFLKSIDAKDIVHGLQCILTTNEKRQHFFPFLPTEDCNSPNRFFVEHPKETLHRGVKVPFIIGFTSCEGCVLMQDIDDEALEQVNSDFASVIHPSIWSTLKQKSITAEEVRFRYFSNEPVSMKTIANYINFLGDMHFWSGLFKTISIQAQQGHRSTYVYKFSYEPEYSLIKKLLNINFPGAIHGEELFYLFYPRINKCLRRKLDFKISAEPKRKLIAECVTKMWTDFAKTGNPTLHIIPSIPVKWTPLETKDKFQYLIIDKNIEIETLQMKKLRFSGIM